MRLDIKKLREHAAFRYGLAVALFLATLALSMAITYAGIRVNLSVPIIFSLLAASWYGGLGPGILLSLLFHGTTILYTPRNADTSIAAYVFSQLSIFTVYLLLVYLISRLHRTQLRLKDQAELLQTTLGSIGDGVIVANNEGSVRFLNPAARALTGYDSEAAIGLPIDRVATIVNKDRKSLVLTPTIEEVVGRSRIGPTNHSRLVGRDGHETPIEYTAAPLKDKSRVMGMVLIVSDVSDRARSAMLVGQRSAEIAALYDFSHRVQAVSRMEEVYDAALDAVFSTLACDRASILLFDRDGVMQFVASRGLSQNYQDAVAGHSPWKADHVNPEPIGIDDICDAELENELLETIREEGICSLGFIPLISNGKLIGKLMVYYDEPHGFTEQEFEMAMTVASQIATGLDRKRTETKLRENEERLRLATNAGKVGVWDWDIRADRIEWTESLFAIHGVDKSTFSGALEVFEQFVHPDDLPEVKARVRASLENDDPYDLQFRIIRPDGRERWLFTDAVTLRDEQGPYRMIGATADITDQINAEQARRESEMMHRIVEAQEAERSRIARDLHDHLGQRMTALRLKIEALARSTDTDTADAIKSVRLSAVDIDRDIGFLSWELRPLELENHGLIDALRSYVREWSQQFGIVAEFRVTPERAVDEDTRFPPDVETNVYRIFQEALNNVVKHSGAKVVSISLHVRPDRLQLMIEDDGRGFSGSERNGNEGSNRIPLGIVGMRERAALLDGSFEIDSTPGEGTSILIAIPLTPSS